MNRSARLSHNRSFFGYIVASFAWIVMFVATSPTIAMAPNSGMLTNTLPVGLVIIFLSILACSFPINLALFGIIVDPLVRSTCHKPAVRIALMIGMVAFSWYLGITSVCGIEALNHPIVGIPFALGACSAFICYLTYPKLLERWSQ